VILLARSPRDSAFGQLALWLKRQARYDPEIEKDRLGDTLDGIRPLSAAG
jgi:hypothetical protein